MPGIEVVGVDSLQHLVTTLRGDVEPAAFPDAPDGGEGRARSGRRPRPQRADPGPRGRGRGRAQPVPAGPARHREDDDRAAAAVDPAAARPDEAIEVTRIQSVAGPARRLRARHGAPVPRPAPHDLRRGARRRRQPAAARRGDARAPRRPLPRRALGVLAPEPRGAAPAARGRARHDRPRPAGDRLPDELHARRRLEPVPVRPRRRALPVLSRRSSIATAAGSPARCWTGSTS